MNIRQMSKRTSVFSGGFKRCLVALKALPGAENLSQETRKTPQALIG
jgi:hypothetical protein